MQDRYDNLDPYLPGEIRRAKNVAKIVVLYAAIKAITYVVGYQPIQPVEPAGVEVMVEQECTMTEEP